MLSGTDKVREIFHKKRLHLSTKGSTVNIKLQGFSFMLYSLHIYLILSVSLFIPMEASILDFSFNLRGTKASVAVENNWLKWFSNDLCSDWVNNEENSTGDFSLKAGKCLMV